MKKPEVYLKEYCARLSDDNLKKLQLSLSQRMSDDLSEALIFLGSVREMDRWFSSATSASELYDMIDVVGEYINKEHKRRCENVVA